MPRRNKRRNRNPRRRELEVAGDSEPLTFDQMAESLVDRGLASSMVTGPQPLYDSKAEAPQDTPPGLLRGVNRTSCPMSSVTQCDPSSGSVIVAATARAPCSGSQRRAARPDERGD